MTQTINGDYFMKKRKKKAKIRNLHQITDGRIKFFFFLTIFCFCFLFIRFVQLMIFQREHYVEQLELTTKKVVYGDSTPRGRIYDRKYRLLVDNESIPVIYYKKQKNVTSEDEIQLAYTISDILKISYDTLTENQLKEFYMLNYAQKVDQLITEEEWKKLENRILTAEDIYILKRSRITKEDLAVFKEKDKKAAMIYSLMNQGYSYDEKEIKKQNVTNQELTYIAEHQAELKGFSVRYDWKRVYPYGNTFRTILGNISKISKEEKEYYLARGYSLNEFVGNSFLEKQYEDYLKGTRSSYYIIDNKKILKEEGKSGNDIVLTIDIKLQEQIEKILEEGMKSAMYDANTELFRNAYVVVQDTNTGEILAMAGREMLRNKDKVTMMDASSGVLTHPMTVGSVVKGASLYVGLANGAVKIGEYQKDECIYLYNKPKKCSWTTMGNINDLTAIANSSNVYQFKIAMKLAGQPYHYQLNFKPKESVFKLYRSTFQQFGLGAKTQIDLPIESVGNIGKNDSGDLLLNFAIGQYDTYTTMQLSQYITTIATGGKKLKPYLLKEVHESSSDNSLGKLIYQAQPIVLNTLADQKSIKRIQQAFHEVMTVGLGKGFMGYGFTNGAGKTGTSESFTDTNHDGIIDTPTLSNAFVGYAPYKKPKVSIAVTFPNIVKVSTTNSLRSYANIRMTRQISEKVLNFYGI